MALARFLGLGLLAVVMAPVWGQESLSADGPPVADKLPVAGTTQEEQKPQRPAEPMIEPVGSFDRAMFGIPIPATDLKGLEELAGVPSGEAWKDKQLKHVLKSIVPGCEFHYGRDMPLADALNAVMGGSRLPVQLLDSRYLLLSGANGQYLAGRGFVWIDLKEGIGLGGFFFRPTNGEPSPTMAVFARQVGEDQMAMSELPPEFVATMARWQGQMGVPAVATQYFLTGTNRRELLQHDADYCAPSVESMTPLGSDCEEMNADAADVDEVAAYYLDQVHYRTNATAWMIGDDQRDWLAVRESTCSSVADPLGCRIRVTRARTRVILQRVPARR